MRVLVIKVVILFAVTTSAANGVQAAPPASDPGSTGGSGGGGTAVPWRFTHPDDGMECSGSVLFAGTGPDSDLGGLSVYSYTNTVPGQVVASELQLQITVIVETDPGVDWVGPIYKRVGESYATIMPALATPNITLLSLGGGGAQTDVGTVTSLNGGQGVLFRITAP